MARSNPPQFTEISKQLAARMPTEGIPQTGVADAIRTTLYAARDAGIMDSLTRIIEDQAGDDEVVMDLVGKLRD